MNRLHEFDALRGIAALAVVFAHLLNYRPASLGNPFDHWSLPLWSFGANGHLAVLIFFAISGFVLSYPYFAGAKTAQNLSIDVLNRLPRLLIPVFLTGLLCFALQRAVGGFGGPGTLSAFASPDWIARWSVEGWDLARVIEFLLTRVFFLYSETDTMNVNLWTMPVEFAFSFLVFALCAVALRRLDYAVLLGAIAVLAILSWRAGMLEYLLKGIAGSVFFFGVLTAYRIDAIRAMVSRHPHLPTLLMVGGLGLSSLLLRHDLHYLLANALGLGAIALFFAGFVSSEPLRRRLQSRSFAVLGELSFALYLIHGSILYAVFTILAATGSYGVASFLIGSAVSLVLSLGLSLAIARYVEMPAVRRVRRAIVALVRDEKPA